jgi:transketolase
MADMIPLSELPARALEVRKNVVRMALEGNYGHIAPALSCVDILVALLHQAAGPDDVFVISKGHAALAWYAAHGYNLDGGEAEREGVRLPGCLSRDPAHGIPCTSGSLGHGMPFALGCALARTRTSRGGRVWCIVGDAESEEGSCQETLHLFAELASPLKLKNLTIIFDNNGLGAMHRTHDTCMANCYRSIDGHNFHEMVTAFKSENPIVSCTTIKGKGIPFMEDKQEWHFRTPTTPEERSWIESWLSSEPTNAPSS